MLVHTCQIGYKNMLKSAVKAGLKMHSHRFRRMHPPLLILLRCHCAAKQGKDFSEASGKYGYRQQHHLRFGCLFFCGIELSGAQTIFRLRFPLRFPAITPRSGSVNGLKPLPFETQHTPFP
ncbi:hypothetical protein D3C81_1606380 [compost metagenome]